MKIVFIVPFFLYKESNIPRFVPADVDVIGVGPRGVFGEGRSDIAYTSSYVMDAVVDAEKKGYDAIIMGGGAGPLIDEARELVDIPVLGLGQVAAYISLLLGHKQGILCSSLPTRRWMEQNVVRIISEQGFSLVREYFDVEAIKDADEVFISNSLIRVMPIASVDGVNCKYDRITIDLIMKNYPAGYDPS